VKIGEDGITESDILIHDAQTEFAGIHLMLANMEYPRFPVALGVIRAYESPASYDEKVENQIANVQSDARVKNVQELFLSGQVWEV
jgi:2-oxoglutarate ferredoxin oxidoreductase subunit beta